RRAPSDAVTPNDCATTSGKSRVSPAAKDTAIREGGAPPTGKKRRSAAAGDSDGFWISRSVTMSAPAARRVWMAPGSVTASTGAGSPAAVTTRVMDVEPEPRDAVRRTV